MKSLFQPIDIASLVFFRIVFGILGFVDVMGSWMYHHLYKDRFNPNNFQFKYYGFEWVQPLPEPLMSVFFILMLAASIGITMGKWYRRCAVFFFIGFTYTFLLEKAHYLNHGYLFCVLCFWMIFLPAQRAFSWDVLKKPSLSTHVTPYWTIFILQFLMGTVYFYGGIAKINPDWLNGLPLKIWLSYKADMPILGGLWKQEWVAYAMSYGGLILDLTIVLFLLFRKTRLWALFAAIFFHTINIILFKIGIFPFLSLALTLLYFPPDFPRKWVAWGEKKFVFIKKIKFFWHKREQTHSKRVHKVEASNYWQFNKRYKIGVQLFMLTFCFIFLLLPLRHHYFKGNVAWTEEGHRYAWRMMLRSKQGYGTFIIKNKKSKKIERVQVRDYLNPTQTRKMFTHPDMILQFAHWLNKRYVDKGKSVEIYADIKVKLNGRNYQTYIDPKVDLTQLKWSYWRESEWIIPEDAN